EVGCPVPDVGDHADRRPGDRGGVRPGDRGAAPDPPRSRHHDGAVGAFPDHDAGSAGPVLRAGPRTGGACGAGRVRDRGLAEGIQAQGCGAAPFGGDGVSLDFEEATKDAAKARIALTGPAGSGKTYTALMLAFGLGEKVAVIDTERGSASK